MGLFTHITQSINLDGTGPEEREVIQTAISDLVVPTRCPSARRTLPWGT